MSLVLVAQTIACIALLRAGLSTLLGGPPPDRRLLIAAAGLTAAAVAGRDLGHPRPADGRRHLAVVFIAPLFGGALTSR